MKLYMHNARVSEIQYPGGAREIDGHTYTMTLRQAWSEARRISKKIGKCSIFLRFMGGGGKVIHYLNGARA